MPDPNADLDAEKSRSMKCMWCGYDNQADANFCGDCGRTLRPSVECVTCGFKNPDQNRFCDACGAALGSMGEAPPVGRLDHQGLPEAGSPRVTSAIGAVPSAVSEPMDVLAPMRPIWARFGQLGLTTGAAAAMLVILGVALVLRLVSLADVPPNVTADEADNLQVVYHILAGQGPGFFGLDWKPAPAFSTYVISGFMRVFGESIVGLRMASVVLSELSLVAFYFLARQVLSKPASLLATLLLATSLWYLHFSRSGWENIHIALYALMTALSLTLAIRRGSWYLYVAAGFFAALGLYGYPSGRVIILAALLYLPVALVLHREQWKRLLLGFALLAAVCAALFAPQLKTALDDWDHFNRRTEAISIFNTLDDYRGDSGLPDILVHQVWRTVDGFFLMDSGISGFGLNARYLPPRWAILDRITGALFWLGLVVSIFRVRQTALWWVMLLALLLPVQVLSTGTPDAARAIGTAPFFYLFVGLGLHWLFSLRLGGRTVLQAALVVVLLAVAYINVLGYFRWMHDPIASSARQPAVELVEFGLWQDLQRADAKEGRWGFNVGQWHEMRGDYQEQRVE